MEAKAQRRVTGLLVPGAADAGVGQGQRLQGPSLRPRPRQCAPQATAVPCCCRVPAFPVDTHIHRLAERWGLSSGKSVEQTEADLKAVFREELWNKLHLQLIWFGRQHCPARGHDPNTCPICLWARACWELK